MPKIQSDRIAWLPSDRYIIQEVSPGTSPTAFTALFNGAVQEGDTTRYFKFLDEITEKDPDVNHSINTRTSNITAKEWIVEGPNESVAMELTEALKSIPGDSKEGLLTVDQLIRSMLGSSYLTGISVSEIVTDSEGILGFNYVPHQFLTFQDSVFYPKLFTQEVPTGVEFNKEKMIIHYLSPGCDPVRGWLGHAVGIQYCLKLQSLEQRVKWQQRYGKGFLVINMPGDRDTYEQAWDTANQLVSNIYNVDGVVFPADVDVDYVDSNGLEGDYFFVAEDDAKKNIVKIILGQDSTSSAVDSNRSTAAVHLEVLETRIHEDMELIEDTITKQLLSKVMVLKGIAQDEYMFKFVKSEMEQADDDEVVEEVEEFDEDGETQQVEEANIGEE